MTGDTGDTGDAAPDESAVRPFHGQLVTAAWAPRVVSPMLDTLRAAEQSVLLETEPDSWLQVASPALAAAAEVHTRQPRGAAALARLLVAGAFAPSDPGVFVYRITDASGSYDGLVVDVAAEAFVSGRVPGHESVQPDRVAAVMQHFEEVSARSELVALLHPGHSDIGATVARTCATPALLDFRSTDGVHQSIWRVDESDAGRLVSRLDALPLYVADGHHRVAASLGSWERAGRPVGSGIPCVIYPPDALRLRAFHRRVAGPVDAGRLVPALRAAFVVSESGPSGPSGPAPRPGQVTAYVDGGWLSIDLAADAVPGVAGLDVVRLHTQVLEPLLGIGSASDARLETIPATMPLSTLAARCDADHGVLFVLAPPTVAQLVDVADRGEVMLAKSTFFEPKPQAGIFLQQSA